MSSGNENWNAKILLFVWLIGWAHFTFDRCISLQFMFLVMNIKTRPGNLVMSDPFGWYCSRNFVYIISYGNILDNFGTFWHVSIILENVGTFFLLFKAF